MEGRGGAGRCSAVYLCVRADDFIFFLQRTQQCREDIFEGRLAGMTGTRGEGKKMKDKTKKQEQKIKFHS